MQRIWGALAIGSLLCGMVGCSLQQRQTAQTDKFHDKSLRSVRGLIETCGKPKTTMTLPNGNTLYIFGEGKDTTTETPVRSIPGHELVMLSGDGRPAKMVKTRNRHIQPRKKNPQDRIVWIETNKKGNILLAGCAGCTAEEDQVLAKAGQEGTDQELLSSLLE